MKQKQKEGDKYDIWKNNIRDAFNKGTIPLDDLNTAANSLLKTKHLQSPLENNTEDFLNECLPWIVSVILNSTVKGERFAKNILSFLTSVVKLVAIFIDYDEDNNENSNFTVYNIWNFFNSIQILFSQRNSNFYQCYQKLIQENPINAYKSKIDANFFTRIEHYFTNLANKNQTPTNTQPNDNNDETKSNSNANTKTDSLLERIRTTLSLILSFDYCFRFSDEIIEVRVQAIKAILVYFFSLFVPEKSNSNESNDKDDNNSCLINLRTLNENLFGTILNLFKSLCTKELKEEFIHDELYICVIIANCQFLNKQFFAFRLIKEILSSSLKDTNECQIIYDLQFIDQVLSNSDLHEELVKPFSEIFVKMMRNKLIKKKEHIKMYWDLVAIKQHSSTIGPFLNGLETIIMATKTGISNYQISTKNQKKSQANQRIFDEEMTDALLEAVAEKNIFPIEIIQFFGKGILILNPKQNRFLFDTLNNIYFKLAPNNNDNTTESKSNDNDDEKIAGKASSNLFTEQETYTNELIKTLCTLIPQDSEDIEENCLKYIQNHDSNHLNYAISLLQASIINNKINPEKADTYLNLLIESMTSTDMLNISQYIQLLSNIILQLKKLHKKQFNTILNFTKSIFSINSSQFCNFYHNLIDQSTSKQFISNKLIKKLFQETCSLSEENSFFNEEIMNFLLYLYRKLDLKSNLDSDNQNIKFIWNLLFKTSSEYASSFLLSVYKESASETAINDFISQCIQHIGNYGSLKSILSMIDSFDNEDQQKKFKENDIFSKPNLYVCEEDDFCSISFTGTVNTKLKIHFDSSYDDVCRKAAMYLGTEIDEVALYDPKTNKIINRSNFEIKNGMIYRVKKLADKKSNPDKSEDNLNSNSNLPSNILIENKEYSQSLFNALQSDDDMIALTAYKILNKIPPLKEFLCPILYLNVKQQPKPDEEKSESNKNKKEKRKKNKKDKKEKNNNEAIKGKEDKKDNDNKNEEENKETTNNNDNDNENKAEDNKDDDDNKESKNDDNKDENDDDKGTYSSNQPENKEKEATIYDYTTLHPDWSKSFNQNHKYLFLYQSNTIGNIIKDHFDPDWISFFFETGGAFEYLKTSLSSDIEEKFKISERDLLTILHVAVLIVKENKWQELISSTSSYFNKEEIIDQIMKRSNNIQISLTIFLLQSILTNTDISNFFNDEEDNKFKSFVKKMLFYKNLKIRKSMKNLISFIIESSKSSEETKKELYEKQENFFVDLINFSISCDKTSDNFFSIMQIFSTEPTNPLKIWKTTTQLLFDKFTIPESDDFIEKLTYKMPSTDLAIHLIIILCNISSYYSNHELDELPDQEQLLNFIINKVLFNGIKYFHLVKQLFELISFILKNKPTLTEIVVQKIRENQAQMKELLENHINETGDPNIYDFSNYKNENNYSINKFSFLSTNLKYRGIRNLGATCYINSTMQQLFSINEMKKLILDESYSMDEWSGNLQLAFSQLLLYPTSYIDLTPFIKHWNGWDGCPINPREQQDAVEFLQMLFGRMEEKMPSFKSLFEGTFQYHFKSCNESIAYENDTFDNFTMLSLEVKGMNCIEDSFRMFVQPEIFNDYKVDDYNGFSGKIDVEKYSMIKKAPEILIIQLKRFEYNLATCTREKLNSKYMFDYELDLAPIMIDQEEPVIYELFGIQMHSGSAQGGHYFSYIKYPKQESENATNSNSNSGNGKDAADEEKKFVWLKFNDTNVSAVDQSTLIDLCCGGNTIIDSTNEAGVSSTSTIIENSSNAYLLYYRRKKLTTTNTTEDSNEVANDNDCSIDSIIKNMNHDLITNLQKDVKKLIFSNIFSSELFSSWIVNSIIKLDKTEDIFYYFILTAFKKGSTTCKNRFYSSSGLNKEIENYVNSAINTMNSQISAQKEANKDTTNVNTNNNIDNQTNSDSNDSLCSQLANYIINQSNDIIYYLLVEDNYQIRQMYLKLLDKAIATSDFSVRVSLVAFLQTKIMDSPFCNSVLLKNWEHFDTFFQSFLSFPRSGYISGEWSNVFASFLFDSFIPYCESNDKGVIYANIDLSSFFTIFTNCQCIQNQKLLHSKNASENALSSSSSNKGTKQTKIKSSPSGSSTMSVITGNRKVDKEFVDNFMLSQKQLHSFIKFLIEYPSFDINLVINPKQSDIDQYNTSTLARYYILSVWFIDKQTEKLYNMMINTTSKDKSKNKEKDIEKIKKFYQTELLNRRNDAIKLNKMITDYITNGRRAERKVTSFLSTLSTLISFEPDFLLSAQSTMEFHSIFIHTLKPSIFYPNLSQSSISTSNYNSIFNSYSTNPILSKFVASEIFSYRSFTYQFIKKLISAKESSVNYTNNNNANVHDDTFSISKVESGELFRVFYGKINDVVNLITKEIGKLKKEEFDAVNPSTDYFGILTKLAKIGDFSHKLVYYEIAKTLISITKNLGQISKKKPVIDCFNFIFETIGVEKVDEFFTPLANREKASEQSIESIRASSYREFLHGFDRFKAKNEYTKSPSSTTSNEYQNYGYSSYVDKNITNTNNKDDDDEDEDDVYSYENVEKDEDESEEFSDFVNFTDTNKYNSFKEIALRMISFVPSYGFDLFFESKFFGEIAGTQYLEDKSNPNSADSFTNMLLVHLNINNVPYVSKALFKKKIFDFYLKNFSLPYFRLICKVLKKFPGYAPRYFVDSNSLFTSILKRIKKFVEQDLKSKGQKSDSDSVIASMLSKTMSLIIFATLSTKSLIHYRKNSKKTGKLKKSDDDLLKEKYDTIVRKKVLLQNQHQIALKDVYMSSLIENGNGLAYLLAAMGFLSENYKDKVLRYISNRKERIEKRCFINSVPQKARKSAAFCVSKICYRSFNLSLFHNLLNFCNELAKSSQFKFKAIVSSSSSSSSLPSLLFSTIKERVDELKVIEIQKLADSSSSNLYFDLFDDEFSVNKKSNSSVKVSFIKIIDEINTCVDLQIFDAKEVGGNLVNGLFMILSLLKNVVNSLIFVMDKGAKAGKGSQENPTTKKAQKFVSSLLSDDENKNSNTNSDETFSIHNLVVQAFTKIYSKATEINDDQLFAGDFFNVVDMVISSKSGVSNKRSDYIPFEFDISKDEAQSWLNAAADLLSMRIKETLNNINIDSIIKSRDTALNVFTFINCIITKFNARKEGQKVEWPKLNVTERQIIDLAKLFESNQNQFCQDAAEILTRLMSVSPLLPNEEVKEEEKEPQNN